MANVAATTEAENFMVAVVCCLLMVFEGRGGGERHFHAEASRAETPFAVIEAFFFLDTNLPK